MIILQCSTRACGRGYREKPFEMITAPDRWMTRLPLSLSVDLCIQCQHMYALYMCLCSPYKGSCALY